MTTIHLYTLTTPSIDEVQGGFQVQYHSDRLFTPSEVDELIEEVQEADLKWTFHCEGDFPLAADGGWCVELESKDQYFELTPFGIPDTDRIINPEGITYEEQTTLREEFGL